MPTYDGIELWARRLSRFSVEARRTLSVIETSQTRSITLNDSFEKLAQLTLSQQDLFKQALRCVEVGVYRAAHVMAWAACADFLLKLAKSDEFKLLNQTMPKWGVNTEDDLAERFTDYAVVQAMQKAGLLKKVEMKAFHGMLSKRNECAHPSSFYPGMNDTLGYISEMFRRIELLQHRHSV